MEDETKYLYDYLDYSDLKNEALKYITKVGYNKWNYFGESDPGITILENLIFGLMDLDYRISFSVADILALDPHKKYSVKNYYLPDEILPMNPVCLNDYYKVILDVDGVINCNIIPIKKDGFVVGCYDIYLYIEPSDDLDVNAVKSEVLKTLNKYRNLCEDFNKIELFEVVDVYIELEIEPNGKFVNNTNRYEDLVSILLADIQNFFVPKIRFSSLSELINRGISLDKIYDGPLLNHGFIVDKDLEMNKMKLKIFTIEIIERILKNEDIVNVISFKLINCKTKEEYLNYIQLSENQAARLNFHDSKIKIFVNGIDVKINKQGCLMLAKRRYLFLIKNNSNNDEELGIYDGQYRNFLDYTSIQSDFPLIYNVGDECGSNIANKSDDESIHQLKCFTLLFDQIFFLYQIVLENLKLYFSIDVNAKDVVYDRLPDDIPSLRLLIKYPSTYSLNYGNVNREFCVQRKYLLSANIVNNGNVLESCNDYVRSLREESNIISREDILGFMLGLFSNYDDNKNNYIDFGIEDRKRYISCCAKLEKERGKAFGLYKNIPWEGSNISGLEKKICVCFNIKNFNRRFLHSLFEENFQVFDNVKYKSELDKNNVKLRFVYKAKYKNIVDLVLYYGSNQSNYVISKKKSYLIEDLNEVENDTLEIRILINGENDRFISIINENCKITDHKLANKMIKESFNKIKRFNEESEGFHLIENILLRPSDNTVSDNDLYSCRLTLVFPSWPGRFQKKEFRTSIEKFIIKISPAHVKIDFLWLNFEDLREFEIAYKNWYNMKNNPDTPMQELDDVNFKFMNLINRLKTKYNSNVNNDVNYNLSEYNVFSDCIA